MFGSVSILSFTLYPVENSSLCVSILSNLDCQIFCASSILSQNSGCTDMVCDLLASVVDTESTNWGGGGGGCEDFLGS